MFASGTQAWLTPQDAGISYAMYTCIYYEVQFVQTFGVEHNTFVLGVKHTSHYTTKPVPDYYKESTS